MPALNQIETTVCYHYINDEILHIKFKDGVEVSYDHMKENKKARLQLQNQKRMKVLVDACDLYSISKEARAYAARKDNSEMSSAMAIVINSLPNKLLVNFFIKFNKPSTPTKMFNSKEKALEWLKSS